MKTKTLLNLIGLAVVALAPAPAGYSGHARDRVSAPKAARCEARSSEVASRGESGQIGRQLQTAALGAVPHPGFSARGESGQIG